MKKFLNTFAAIAAGFAAQSVSASTPQRTPEPLVPHGSQPTAALKRPDALAIRDDAGNMFNFVLKRSAETGQMMAWHESHASHASHASHSSHYSSSY
jgi:hypothetical protein